MLVEGSDIQAVLRAAEALDPAPHESLMVLVAEHQPPDLHALVEALKQTGRPFFGGVFPALVHEGRKIDQGVVLQPLPTVGPPTLVTDLCDSDALSRSPAAAAADGERATALVFVDGLAADISTFLGALFHRFGGGVSYLGGGAGSLSLEQAPCVFSADGLFQDAAVVALLPLRCSLGVRHGWQQLMGPLVATRTRRNVILELNWEPAFDVYRRVVDADADADLDWTDFFAVAKRYPFGIFREGAEDVVRDPIAVTPEGALVCVGDVPENTVLNILKGNPDSLVAAAAQAARDSAAVEEPAATRLVVDCISRVLYLEEGFSSELAAFQAHGAPPVGVLSLGEIASRGDGFVEFFNKTIVIGALYE